MKGASFTGGLLLGLAALIGGCPGRKAYPNDGVDLGNGGRPAAAAVLHVSRDGKCDQTVILGRHRIGFGNLVSTGCPPTEAIVFRMEHSVKFGSRSFTDATDETLLVTEAAPRLTIDVALWIPKNDRGDVLDTATTQHCRADQVFNSMRCGVAFRVFIRRQEHAYSGPYNPCDGIEALRALGYRPNAINVYYVQGPAKGQNCDTAREMIYVDHSADYETLAHEIGHALGLSLNNQHVGPKWNIMSSNNPVNVRDVLTLGQCIRVNLSENSILHRFTDRYQASLRQCPENVGTPDCPRPLWPDQSPDQSPYRGDLDPTLMTDFDAMTLKEFDAESVEARQADGNILQNWLYCEECNRGELQAAVALLARRRWAANAVCSSARAGQRAEELDHLRKTYLALAEYETTHPGTKVGADNFERFRYLSARAHMYRRNLRAILVLQEPGAKGRDASCTAASLFAALPSDLQTLMAPLTKF